MLRFVRKASGSHKPLEMAAYSAERKCPDRTLLLQSSHVRLCLGITDRRRCRPSGDDSACCGELGGISRPGAPGRHMACLPGLRLDTIHPERARACGTRHRSAPDDAEPQGANAVWCADC